MSVCSSVQPLYSLQTVCPTVRTSSREVSEHHRNSMRPSDVYIYIYIHIYVYIYTWIYIYLCVCVSKLTIIGSDNGSSPGRRQAIIWVNAGIMLSGTFWISFSEILSEIDRFSFKKNAFENVVREMAAISLPQYVKNARKEGPDDVFSLPSKTIRFWSSSVDFDNFWAILTCWNGSDCGFPGIILILQEIIASNLACWCILITYKVV